MNPDPTVVDSRDASPERSERVAPLARHGLDPVALLFGVAFMTVGAARLAERMDWIKVDNRVWFGTAIVILGLIAAGVIAVRGLREGSHARPVGDS